YGDRLNAVLQADLLRPLQSGVHVPHSLRATGRERRNLLVALWLCWGARTSGYADLSSGRRHSLAIRSHSRRHPAGAGPGLSPRLHRRAQCLLVRLHPLQRSLQLVQGLLIRELLAHASTSSTRPPSVPEPSWIVTFCSTEAWAAERKMTPVAASRVML